MKRRVCKLAIPVYYTPQGNRTCAANAISKICPMLTDPHFGTVYQCGWSGDRLLNGPEKYLEPSANCPLDICSRKEKLP